MTPTSNPGPLARFEGVKADESAPLEIFSRLAEGETLKAIAKAWEVPKGRFCQWFTTEHAELYDAALKVCAAELALEAYEASRGKPRQAVSPDGKPLFDEAGKPVLEVLDVARDKLRADVALKIASKWDRARYGESVQVRHSGETVVRLTFGGGVLPTVGRVLEEQRVLPSAVELPEDI